MAGVYTVSSDCGALATTNMGTVIRGDPNMQKRVYVESAVGFLQSSASANFEQVRKRAVDRFNTTNICRQWSEKVFK